MKKTILGFMGILFAITSMAQTDSIQVERKNDTIHIGGMVILKKGDPNDKKHVTVTVGDYYKHKKSNISTTGPVFDIGFANWTDKTNYASATSNNYLVTPPGAAPLNESDFKLRTSKSVNVNIWFFMQRLNLVKHYLNLKYGLGLELNNYRFESEITFKNAGANPYDITQNIPHPFIFEDSISFSKNKLAADYATIPFMLNFVANPNQANKAFSFSAGVSVGYLYSSRNKQISDERGKVKNRGNDLEQWKFAYIAELGMGPVHLYGSYSPNSVFQHELNFKPYSIGLRFSNW